MRRINGDYLHWSTSDGRIHCGFHRHGNCWSLLSLPQVTRYRSGMLLWLSWWRLFLSVERRPATDVAAGETAPFTTQETTDGQSLLVRSSH